MANPIIRIKRSSVPGKIPNASQVPLGEIALNTYDGKVFASRNVGIGTTVFVVNPWTVGTGTDTYNTYFTEGNVGIGTTIPSEKLDVVGNVNISGIITTSALSVGSTLTHTGTTASLNNTTAANTLNLATGATGSGVLKTINVGTGGAAGSRLLVNIGSATAGTASTVVVNSGTNVLIGAATSTGTASQPLQVTGGAYVSGNLGVGAINPSASLDVRGSAIITNIGNPSFIEVGNGQNSNQFAFIDLVGDTTYTDYALRIIRNNTGANASSEIIHRGTERFQLKTVENSPITFATANTERVRIDPTGNVGIGTNIPIAPLHINTSSVHSDGNSFLRLVSSGGLNYVQSGLTFTSGSATDLIFTSMLAATEWARFRGGNFLIGAATSTGTASQPLQVTGGAYVSGNLGVGATNPSDKLHVLSGNIRVDSTIGALTFWSGAGFFGGIGMAQAFGGSGTDLNLRSDTNRNIIFQTGGANERVRITSTGNVGIGTTNPGASLEILAPELNGSTPELRLSAPGGGANGVLELHHSLTGASYNNIVQTGDKAIIFRGTSSVGTGALVIAPHASATSGIRMIGSTGDILIGSATPTGTASQPLQVTGGAYVSGNVGIGTTNPASRLHVLANQASGYAATFDNDGNNANRFGIRIQCGVDTGAGTAVAIDDGDGTNQGNITFNAGTVTYGAFTANHDCVIPSYEGEIPYGTLIITNEILYKKRPSGEEMERGILYSAGISTTPYSKRLLGAYSYAYDLDSPVQSGSDLPVHQVLVLGDGHILCCGEKGNIKFGDGITSSSREGIGMKMDKIGMVIGIAQEDVEFEEDEVKLVPVQYGLHQYIPDNIAEVLESLI